MQTNIEIIRKERKNNWMFTLKFMMIFQLA